MNDPINSTTLDTAADGLDEAASDMSAVTSGRRKVMRTLGKLGLGAFALSIPAATALRVQKAHAQSAEDVPGILNFALTLEYLEAVYYNTGVDTDGLIPEGVGSDVYNLIAQHETAHVSLLNTAISAAGAEPRAELDIEDFDFTAGGAFPDPFTNYDVYLALSQAFEDTGVRAYKGQAARIPRSLDVTVEGVGTFNVLTTALQIHSLEARHAAEVRRLRAVAGQDSLQPWITGDEPMITGFNEAVQPVYAGEDNLMQGGVDVTTLGDGYSDEVATEAFDEPLSMDDVNTIANLFIIGDGDDDDDSDG